MREHEMIDGFEPDDGAGVRLKGWHVLLMLLAFFGVMFIANGIFLYSAITSFPGEAVPKSYTQGLDYNRSLEARARQAALGWTAAIGVVERDGEHEIVARLQGADGSGLTRLDVMAEIRRPTTNAGARLVTLELTGAGEYRAVLDAIAPGAWDVRLEAFKPGEQTATFTARKQLVVK